MRPARVRHQASPRRTGRRTGPRIVVVAALLASVGVELVVGRGQPALPPGGGDVALRTDASPSSSLGTRTLRPAPELAGEPEPVVNAPRPPAATPAVGPPTCTFDDLPAPRSGLGDWATTLVDTAYVLPDGYRPADLVPVGRSGIGGSGLVRSLVIDDLRALADAARAAGNPLAVQSAYRSRARQADVFADWVARSGEAQARRFSARPGHSEHQLGTALDLRAAAGGAPWSGSFGSTRAGRWLREHATEYGFVLSYPAGAEDVTCYGAEAWHVRYVGREIAAEVAESGLPLRAWLGQRAGG